MSKIGIFKEQLDKLIGDKFGKYSKYIIQERALPDLRDGLKPVQRRILFAMYSLGLTHTSAYKKSARVVGDVIGKYHPHGDTSVYEAMVRMSQEWKINSPLIDMHGNKGSIDGDSAAAMRYTEARLGPVAKYLLENIDKNLVSFVPNFDDSELEPVVLPALYPNLLVNGATGIAAGYATNIPPHNFNEVLKALIFVLENEEIRLSDLTRIIKGPDFPTGGILQSKKSIREAYQNGKGRVVIRSKIDFDEKKNQIIITEIPFETYKVDIVKQIDELIRAGKLPSLKDVRDDSDRQGLQITIHTKADINIDAVLNYLYKNTDLQKNYSFNMVVIKDKKPQLLGLSNILQSFAGFQIEIYTKLFAFELAKAQKRAEIVEGLISAISILDKVIKEIRVSKNKSDAVANLIKKFGFTPNQAEAIVNLRLYRLTSTDVHELEDEKKDLLKQIGHFNKGIKDRKYLVSNIVSELNKILEEFPTKRKSRIEEEVSELTIDEKLLIQEEKVQLVVTNHGYVKRVSMKSKDSSEKSDLGVRDDDVVISNTTVSNMENLAVFTSSGRFFTIPVYKLMEHKWKDIGDHLSKYFSIEGMDRIVAIATVHDFNFEGTLVVSTEQGLIKQTPINDLSMTITKKGSKYVNLKENDSVVSVAVNKTKTTGQVISVTADCNIVRYELSDVPIVGLNSSGVKNITLEKNDTVVASIVDSKGEIESGKSQLILFTDNGKAKRFRINEIKLTSRPSKGIQVAKPNKSNPHEIVNMFNISLVDEINILTKDKNHIVFNPTGDVLLTDLDSGLNNVTREGIDLVFNDLKLDFSSLKKTEPKTNNEPEEQKPVKQRTAEQKLKQLTLDNILDNI